MSEHKMHATKAELVKLAAAAGHKNLTGWRQVQGAEFVQCLGCSRFLFSYTVPDDRPVEAFGDALLETCGTARAERFKSGTDLDAYLQRTLKAGKVR